MGGSRFSAVALHWLLGLIHLARGDETRALEEFERELSFENAGQLYARECAANTWYAIGALRLRQGRRADAGAAFARAIERVATHPMARVGLVAAGSLDPIAPPPIDSDTGQPGRPTPSVDAAVFQAAQLVVAGAHTEAARILDEALAGAAAGNAGWLLPIEPLLHVTAHPDIWARALAHLAKPRGLKRSGLFSRHDRTSFEGWTTMTADEANHDASHAARMRPIFWRKRCRLHTHRRR